MWVERAIERSSHKASVGRAPGPRRRRDDWRHSRVTMPEPRSSPTKSLRWRGNWRTRCWLAKPWSIAGYVSYRRGEYGQAEELVSERLSSPERACRGRADRDSALEASHSSYSGISAWFRSSSTSAARWYEERLRIRGLTGSLGPDRCAGRTSWRQVLRGELRGGRKALRGQSATAARDLGISLLVTSALPRSGGDCHRIRERRARRATAWGCGGHRRIPRCPDLPQRPAGSRSLPERADRGIGRGTTRRCPRGGPHADG